MFCFTCTYAHSHVYKDLLHFLKILNQNVAKKHKDLLEMLQKNSKLVIVFYKAVGFCL